MSVFMPMSVYAFHKQWEALTTLILHNIPYSNITLVICIRLLLAGSGHPLISRIIPVSWAHTRDRVALPFFSLNTTRRTEHLACVSRLYQAILTITAPISSVIIMAIRGVRAVDSFFSSPFFCPWHTRLTWSWIMCGRLLGDPGGLLREMKNETLALLTNARAVQSPAKLSGTIT